MTWKSRDRNKQELIGMLNMLVEIAEEDREKEKPLDLQISINLSWGDRMYGIKHQTCSQE